MQKRYWELEYKRRGKLWRGSSREKSEIERILLPGMTLDAGCGNGKETPSVEGIIGLDFARNALKLYVPRNKVQGDITCLPFKDNTFSNVLFLHSIDHLLENERRIALNEANRILKPNGRLIIKVFSINDFRSSKGSEIEKNTYVRGNKIRTHYFTPDEFNDTPFKSKEVRNINYNIIINGLQIKREELIIILTK